VRAISIGLLAAALAGAMRASEMGPAMAAPWAPKEGASLIGTRAPDLRGVHWLQGGPLTLAALKGKVVLLRFWLTGCPYCERTAPALEELHETYAARGLVVIGLHHPKSEDSRDAAVVEETVRRLRMRFPVGLDDRWETVRAYSVGTQFQRFTSVSFLIDRSGIIRFVHDGGEFHSGGGPEHRDCNAAFGALRAAVERALEDAPRAERGAP
jgi:thiol-disulfide isomerase/thioredoxin